MILWIEAQETAIIALLVFALCYALAGAILAAINLVPPGRIAAS